MIFCISANWSWPKPFSARPSRSFFRVSGTLQRARSSASSLKNSGSFPKSSSMNCWAEMGVPEGGRHHGLDGAFFAVGKLHFHSRLFLAHARALTAHAARFFLTLAGPLAAIRAWLRLNSYALAGMITTLLAGFWFQRLAVPLRIAEMVVGLHEVVDGEVVL